ncbi:MAG: hypothetical protein AAF431_07120 [Pseudomonadota bacterium]
MKNKRNSELDLVAEINHVAFPLLLMSLTVTTLILGGDPIVDWSTNSEIPGFFLKESKTENILKITSVTFSLSAMILLALPIREARSRKKSRLKKIQGSSVLRWIVTIGCVSALVGMGVALMTVVGTIPLIPIILLSPLPAIVRNALK